MTLNEFIQQVKTGHDIDFQQTIAIIAEYYHYQPTQFSNGLQTPLLNEAGRNEGSCKIFAFAQLHQLDEQQTLSLFGNYYRLDVLGNPEGSDHQNIRHFIRDGWAGIAFAGTALRAKHAD